MTDDEILALAAKVAGELQGTSQSLTMALDEDLEHLEINDLFTARLDQFVFCCERCDWWHEQSEMAERDDFRWICQQCTDEGA